MIRIGRNERWLNDYSKEIDYSREAGFEFHQVWYDKNGISITGILDPKEEMLRDSGFPCIIHALFDITEFEEHIFRIRDITKVIRTDELIIHPVCENEPITSSTPAKLSEKVKTANRILKESGITLFIENNSKIDPFNYKTDEIKALFKENPEVEFLLDVAHIDSYKHLEEMVLVKMPKKLHIADKRQNVPHEHLPLGKGSIDFKYIFSNVLKNFDGDIILEITADDDSITRSKKTIESLIRKS